MKAFAIHLSPFTSEMRKRSLARDWALKILYQTDITHRPIERGVEEFFTQGDLETQPCLPCPPNRPAAGREAEVFEFCKRLVFGVHEHLKEIDAKISQYATNWQLKRMAIIDRNVLRIGVFELQYTTDIPPKVTINEAVELAKKYGDLDSSKFVNGILDNIHKTEVIPKGEKS